MEKKGPGGLKARFLLPQPPIKPVPHAALFSLAWRTDGRVVLCVGGSYRERGNSFQLQTVYSL